MIWKSTLILPALVLAACSSSPSLRGAPEFELANASPRTERASAPSTVRVTASSAAPALEEGPSDVSVAASVRTAKVPGLRMAGEESLRNVARIIQDASGVPIVVSAVAEDAVFDAGTIFDFELSNELTAENALNLIVSATDADLAWTVRHGTVLLTTGEKARGDLVFALHDIRAITMGRTDFSGPRIDRLRLLEELEDDDGGGPFGGVLEHVVATPEEDVVTLVQENIAPTTWADDGVSIDAQNGQLFVTHTAAVQSAIRRFLATLGA